jgi:glycosyltransferase involved in cell wall biosynthesis
MSTVAVVMCTYNGEKHLPEQLNSILRQSRRIDELVIVDDVSADNTIEIIQSIVAHFPEIKTTIEVNSTNLGYVRNFQKAASLASSDILFLSDQDDIWHEHKVEKMMPLFDKSSTWAAYHDGELIDENGNNLNKTLFGTRRRAKLNEGLNRDMRDVLSNIDVNGCTMAVRKTLIENCPLPAKNNPELWGHDHWWALHAHALHGLVVMNDNLFRYRIHSANASGKINTGFEFNRIMANWKLAKIQGNDFYVLRYQALKKSIESLPKEFFFNRDFLSIFTEALNYFITQNELRKNIANQSFFVKLKTVKRIYQSGFYQNYLNGIATAVRDVLI